MASYYFLQYFNIFLNKILQCYQMIEILDYIILPGFSKNFFLEQDLIKKKSHNSFFVSFKNVSSFNEFIFEVYSNVKFSLLIQRN